MKVIQKAMSIVKLYTFVAFVVEHGMVVTPVLQYEYSSSV